MFNPIPEYLDEDQMDKTKDLLYNILINSLYCISSEDHREIMINDYITLNEKVIKISVWIEGV